MSQQEDQDDSECHFFCPQIYAASFTPLRCLKKSVELVSSALSASSPELDMLHLLPDTQLQTSSIFRFHSLILKFSRISSSKKRSWCQAASDEKLVTSSSQEASSFALIWASLGSCTSQTTPIFSSNSTST